MRTESVVLFAALVFVSGCVHVGVATPAASCVGNPELQKEKSAELERMEHDDQMDRTGSTDAIDWNTVGRRDLERRAMVASIFAAGCFKDAKDYANAALIFQHGDSPDHYYQAFLWSMEAVKRGEPARSRVAAGIDRYLVAIGRKQLFGTQFSKTVEGLWCLEPVEKSFTEKMRMEYRGMKLKEDIAFFLNFYKSEQKADEIPDCHHELKPSPAGTVPGFW